MKLPLLSKLTTNPKISSVNSMKYFTHDLIAKANDWIIQTENDAKKAEKHFWKVAEKYYAELETLKHRVSKPAWNFFRFGYAETGLHDASLMSFCIGDNLAFRPGSSEFRRKRFPDAKLEFINYTKKYLHVFQLRQVKDCKMNMDTDFFDGLFEKNFGDLFTYELCAFDDDHLQIGFVFANGTEISIVFRKLVYKRHTKPFKSF